MLIEKFDFISPNSFIYYLGKNKHSSIFSGIVSIFILIICLILSIFLSLDFLLRKNPNINYVKTYAEDKELLFSKNSLFPYLTFLDGNNNIIELDKKIHYVIGAINITRDDEILKPFEHSHWIYDKCEGNLSDYVKNVEVDYAMYLLSLPISNEALALSYFENNTDLIRNRKSLNLKGAYAYALSAAGHKAESDSLMNLVLSKADSHNLFYNYWSHRILKSERDYKGAYYKLWEAQQISDSLSLVSQSESAAKAQLEFNEQVLLNNKLKNRNALLLFGFFTLLFLFATLFLVILLRIIHKKKKEEKEKMIFTIESLENQLLTLSEP